MNGASSDKKYYVNFNTTHPQGFIPGGGHPRTPTPDFSEASPSLHIPMGQTEPWLYFREHLGDFVPSIFNKVYSPLYLINTVYIQLNMPGPKARILYIIFFQKTGPGPDPVSYKQQTPMLFSSR